MSGIETPWLTLGEAAQYARCSEETLRRACASGELQSSRVGERGRWLIHRDALDSYLRGEPQNVPVPVVTRRRSA